MGYNHDRKVNDDMLRLTSDEQEWLNAYRTALEEQYPGAVTRMVIYGSKARGDDHANSDLDLLLIIKNDASVLKRQLRRVGYRLAATTDVVPSIFAYTENEWESRKRSGSPFHRTVERDAVRVL